MASINEVYGDGTTLKAEDLKPGIQHRCTIKEVAFREFDDGNKLAITFLNADKVLICNKTNATRIADEHGTDYTLWTGLVVYLQQDITEFQGRPTKCVRVVPHDMVRQDPPAAPEAPQPGVPAAQTKSAMTAENDDIPF